MQRAVLGVGLAAVLLVVHMTGWRAARNAFTRHLAYPIVAAVDTERAAQFRLDATSFDRTLTATPILEGGPADVERAVEIYRAPANLDYLLAGLVLIAVFPRRRYWLGLWGVHVALGIVALAAFVVGVGWAEIGFRAGDFVRVYLARAASLVALLVAFTPHWERRLREAALSER